MIEKVTLRLMTVDDIDQVLKVEHASFPVPWSKDAFYNEIVKNHFANYVVLEYEGTIIGYCGVWIIIDEAHITNIAVLPEFRGKKLGEELMYYMISLAREMGGKTMTLEVRMSNERAQNLYRKLGFQNGGVRKNYYSDNLEDALVMWVNL
jgi:[ribosomal protein S18]-alanine N-acetyltransferase